MNTLLHWLTSPEWALVVRALLHSLWQGAVIAAGLALLLRCVHSPTLRYRLTLGGLATVVASAVITWAVLNAPKAATSEFVAAPPQITEPVPEPTGPVQRIIVAADRKQAQPQMQWTAWLALVWLLGASAMLGRASVKVAGAEQLRRSCRPLDDERITKLVADARRAVKLTRQIRVAVTNQLTSPAVVGVLVPTLILPLSLITTLSPEQLRFILLHELAHIRRGDYLANLFQLFAEALLFFNPAVWWLSHQIRREREACCDALAIELSGAPTDYARTLVSVAETMLRPSPAAAPAFGGEREPSSLTDRVHRALVPDHRPALRLTWRTMLAALVTSGVLLCVLATGTRETVAATTRLLASGKPSPGSDPLPSTSGTSGSTNLYNRTFKISAPELARVTGNVGPVMATNSLESARAFFAQAGVDVTAPGRAMFFKDTLGWLFVRATTTELETIERILTGRTAAAPNPKSATEASKPITASPVSLNPGAKVTYSIFDVTTVTVLADGRYSYRRANLNLEGLRSRLIEWTNVIMNSRFAILTHSNAPAGSISNAVALIKEFGATPDIETLIPPDFSSRWEPMTDTSKEGLALAGVMPTKPSPSVEPSRVFGSDDTNLHTRTFKVDPNSFVTGLETASGLKTTNLQERIRAFFTSVGVDLQPPKAVFFNDRQGGLFVRASLADLDIIEQAIQVLAAQPLQVNIRAKFVEVPMGNQVGKLLENLLPAATNVLTGGNSRQMLTNGFAGILTDSQAKAVFKALEQTEGVDILTMPEVTTLSGRQAQLQVVDIRTVVTGATSITINGVTTNGFQTSALPFGPVLDVIPYVSADGYTVQMTIIPTITEFLGYDRPDAALTEYARTNSLSAALPLPRYRVRQLTTSALVWDGQTIVLGGFISEMVTPQPDGSEIRKPDSKVEKKQLFIFITPTIIDSAGNRVHHDEDKLRDWPTAPSKLPEDWK